MRFRLFRSRAFWFGVPGLVGLLWGWWVSMGHRPWVELFASWGIGLSAGEVYAYYIPRPTWYSEDMGVGYYEVEREEAVDWKKKLMASHEFPDSRLTFVPCYWLVLSYLAMWTGMLIWRKRKYEQRPVE